MEEDAARPDRPGAKRFIGRSAAGLTAIVLGAAALGVLVALVQTRSPVLLTVDWHNVRRHLDRLHVGTFTGPTGLFRQRTELSKPQHDLLAKLDVPAPKQIIELTTSR